MTIPHAIDYYTDGHMAIAYCKICSAEGEKLLESCYRSIDQKISDDECDFVESLLTNNCEQLNRKY